MTQSKLTVLTRDVPGNQSWQKEFEACGIATYNLPCIATTAADQTLELNRVLKNLHDFEWIIFTSAAGVEYFERFTAELAINIATIHPRIAVVGNHTGSAAIQIGLEVAFTPSSQNASALALELPDVSDGRVLILRSDLALQEPVEILRRRSAIVADVSIYQTSPVTQPDAAFEDLLCQGKIGHICFASPSAVNGFILRVAKPGHLKLARSLPSIAIGETVATALKASGFKNILVATAPSPQAVADLVR